MKFDVDLSTGKVRAEFTIDEAQEILAALKAVREAPRGVPEPEGAPPMWVLPVESFRSPGTFYETRIWFGSDGVIKGACQCKDNVYRRHWCKHLTYSNRARLRALSAAGNTYAGENR
jgi:hypothetical protein